MDFVKKIAIEDDTAAQRQLKFTHVSAVTWVTDEAKCLRAIKSLDTTYWTAPRGGPVYLIQVGTGFAVFPGDPKSAPNDLLIHMDSNYKLIAAGGWL